MPLSNSAQTERHSTQHHIKRAMIYTLNIFLAFWPLSFYLFSLCCSHFGLSCFLGVQSERRNSSESKTPESFDDVFSDVVCHFECCIAIKIGLDVSAHIQTETQMNGIFGNLLNYLATCTCWPFFLLFCCEFLLLLSLQVRAHNFSLC